MEKEKIKAVVWSVNASKQLQIIVKYLVKISDFAVDTVTEEIEKKTINLASNYNSYRVDELKTNNNNSYRVCFVFTYRISYRIAKEKVHILAIRHTSRIPFKY